MNHLVILVKVMPGMGEDDIGIVLGDHLFDHSHNFRGLAGHLGVGKILDLECIDFEEAGPIFRFAQRGLASPPRSPWDDASPKTL